MALVKVKSKKHMQNNTEEHEIHSAEYIKTLNKKQLEKKRKTIESKLRK